MNFSKLRVACVIGTRPELIKMAPVIHLLTSNPHYSVEVINTAQHRGLLDDMFPLFDVQPTLDFDVMRDNQSLALLTARLFEAFQETLANKYDLILVQGDTTTSLVAAQVAFFNRIPVGHIEAGLRSYDFYHPFPEEMNRVFTSKLASLHFAPTQQEANILIAEGIKPSAIFVTGNTVIDSLQQFAKQDIVLPFQLKAKRLILVTMHRRESFGEPLRQVFKAFNTLVNRFADIEIVYPIHPNPNVRKMAEEELKNNERIHLIEPVSYEIFIGLMKQAYLIMSDSGGIQEEAPALNKPLLILRNVTERPLVVEMGMAKLVGTNETTIVSAASELLADPNHYKLMQKGFSPYGDGHAAQKIVAAIEETMLQDKRVFL